MKQLFFVMLCSFILILACGSVTRTVTPTPNLAILAATATVKDAATITTEPIAVQPEMLVPTPTPQTKSTPESSTSNISLPDTANLQEVIDQLAAKREACDPNATSAQQEKALEAPRSYFLGKTVVLTGTINDVRNINGKYDAIISLQKVDVDVLIKDLSEDLALTLNKGDYALINGQLELGGCYIYTTATGELTVLN